MASVQILRGLTVVISSVDEQGFFMPMPSSLLSSTPDTIYHSLGVRDGQRFVIQLIFDPLLLGASQANYLEVAARIDGFNVTHGHVSVPEIRANGGVFTITSFPDGITGMAKTAEFRKLATAASAAGEDVHTLYRAQQVGQIQVDVRYEWGEGFVDTGGSLHSPRHDGSYSSGIRKRTRATCYTHYGDPSPHGTLMIALVRSRQLGPTGHFIFLYNNEDFNTRLHSRPQVGPRMTPRAPNILPDGMSTGHLIRGALSTIAPDSQHQKIGIDGRPRDLDFITPYTAGVQPIAPSPALQPPSIGTGDGSSATSSNNPNRRLQGHNSVIPHTAGAQSTASAFTSQQSSIGNGNGYSVPPNNYPTSFADPHYQRTMPPPASTTNARSMQWRGASSASGLHGSGPSSSNAQNSNNRRPAYSPNPLPRAIHSNGRASTGLTNRPLAPAPAPAPSALQQEATGRRGSAPASHPNDAAAGMRRGTTGLKTLAPAPTTTDPVRSRAPSFPATSQAQSGTGSAGGSLQASQSTSRNAPPGPNQTTRKAPSKTQAGIGSAGGAVLSPLTTEHLSLFDELADLRPPPPPPPAPIPGPDWKRMYDADAEWKRNHAGAARWDFYLAPARAEYEASQRSAGAGGSSRPATSHAQSGTGFADGSLQAAQLRAAGAFIGPNGHPRLAPSQAQAQAPAISTEADDSSSSDTSQAQSMTTPAPARADPWSSPFTSRTWNMNGYVRPGVPRRRAALQPIFSAGGGQDGLQASASNNAAAAVRRRTSDPRALSQAQSAAASAEPGSSPETAIVIDSQAMSPPATGGSSASIHSVNLQATSTTGPVGPGMSTIPASPQSAATPATDGDGGGVSSPPVTNTSQDQSLAASAAAGASTVSANPPAMSTPATGGGGNPSFPIVPAVESMIGSGNDGASSGTLQDQSTAASVGADVPTLTVNPQPAFVAATGRGAFSSFYVGPQRASTTGTGSDNSDNPSSKKRKRVEKQSKDSPGRTKK